MSVLMTLDASSTQRPVLYVNGDKDLIKHASNCTGMIQAGSDASDAFKETTDVESEIIDGAGHALDYHRNVHEMYGSIVDWTKKHGF